MGVRFVLGLAECAVTPAFVTLTSIWYKKGNILRLMARGSGPVDETEARFRESGRK